MDARARFVRDAALGIVGATEPGGAAVAVAVAGAGAGSRQTIAVASPRSIDLYMGGAGCMH